LGRARNTEWGKRYHFSEINRIDSFRERVPISTYEELYPDIERHMLGEPDILWPGRIEWFAKSSGTTNDKSKYIPVSHESLEDCHYKAGQDMLAMYLTARPDSKLFTGKSLSIGGSHTASPVGPQARVGDVSAVILENLPKFYELMRAPSKEVALMDQWESKIEAMAREIEDENITGLAGVPTWTMVLINRLFERKGITSGNLLEIWPDLEVFFHGGVSFTPYLKQFEAMIPSDSMTYIDCYNASEGFFGLQNDPDDPDLLLLLDYGIFYEFIKVEELHQEQPRSYILSEIELGQNYAMVISTNGGLWRYCIGDTIAFTSRTPYKFRVTGRTKQFINAFGEELMVDNAERAIAFACQKSGAEVKDYTAGPIYLAGTDKGGHEWVVEFSRLPENLSAFTQLLDQRLRELNSDYDAKRTADLALSLPRVHSLPEGSFHRWMKKRNKLGGQHKVPRLANSRQYLEDILETVLV
ncbi:MAG: GH3 auxin-responsive promoter family protein, partial [Bacteroidota bacterium]